MKNCLSILVVVIMLVLSLPIIVFNIFRALWSWDNDIVDRYFQYFIDESEEIIK